MVLSIPTVPEAGSIAEHIFETIFFIVVILASLGGIIGFIYYIYQCVKGKEYFELCAIPIVLFIFVMFAFFDLIFGYMAITYGSRKQEYEQWYATEYEEITYNEIYSLDLQNEVSGHFALGSGRIDTDNYYYFYIKSGSGLYQFTKLKYNNDVFIKEVQETPKVIQRKDKDSNFVYYVIYVPAGTVINSDYKVV